MRVVQVLRSRERRPPKRRGVWGIAQLRAGLGTPRGRASQASHFVVFVCLFSPAASTSQEFSLRSLCTTEAPRREETWF